MKRLSNSHMKGGAEARLGSKIAASSSRLRREVVVRGEACPYPNPTGKRAFVLL